MNLKKLHILLLMMCMILLVCIGSVSAIENNESNVDDIATDYESSISPTLSNGNNATNNNDTNGTQNNSEKINTEINAEDIEINSNDSAKINISVKDNESNKLNITKSDLNVSENNKTLAFTFKNSTITILSDLNIGEHNIIITYLGNATYANSSTNISIKIHGMDVPKSVNVNSTNTVVIPITISNGTITEIDKDKLNLTVGMNNTTKVIDNFELKNGTIIFQLNNFKTATLTITYPDEKYNKTTKTVVLKSIINVDIIPIKTVNQYKNGAFTFKLIDVDTGEVLANKTIKISIAAPGSSINSGYSIKTNNEGIASINTSNIVIYSMKNNTFTQSFMDVGKYNVTVSVETTNTTIVQKSKKVLLEITKADIVIQMKDLKDYYGTNKNLTITVTNKLNGEPVRGIILKLHIPKTNKKYYYFVTDKNGTSKISIKQLVGGIYDVTVSNNDTTNIKETSANAKLTILKKPVVITTKSKTMYYNSGETAIIKISDKNGKAVPGAAVLVTLHTKGKKAQNYLFLSDKKGYIKFIAPLSVGKHKMVVNSADTRFAAKSVTKYITVKKANGKLSAPKTTAFYKQNKYFTIKLTNSKNKKAIYNAKLNIRVFIAKTKYYNFNGKTGANGQLKLLINLNPGSYKVMVLDKDPNMVAKQITSKIIVKKAPTKLIPTKVNAKVKTSKLFKVKVINKKTKKIISGVKIKIKVYTGKQFKTFNVKTNKNGIAQINTKSLKAGNHNVIVTSADKYCVASAAKSTIKITK